MIAYYDVGLCNKYIVDTTCYYSSNGYHIWHVNSYSYLWEDSKHVVENKPCASLSDYKAQIPKNICFNPNPKAFHRRLMFCKSGFVSRNARRKLKCRKP